MWTGHYHVVNDRAYCIRCTVKGKKYTLRYYTFELPFSNWTCEKANDLLVINIFVGLYTIINIDNQNPIHTRILLWYCLQLFVAHRKIRSQLQLFWLDLLCIINKREVSFRFRRLYLINEIFLEIDKYLKLRIINIKFWH